MSGARAAFLDRDGVLNALVQRDGLAVSPRTLAEFRILPDAAPAVGRLRAAGFSIFVVTNQPDIARGHLARTELDQMHNVLRKALAPDDIAVCPHDDKDACPCRKPNPGMLRDLALLWKVDLEESVMIGDSWKDVEAGRRAGCRTILVSAAPDARALAAKPDIVVPTLAKAVHWIVSEMKAPSPRSR